MYVPKQSISKSIEPIMFILSYNHVFWVWTWWSDLIKNKENKTKNKIVKVLTALAPIVSLLIKVMEEIFSHKNLYVQYMYCNIFLDMTSEVALIFVKKKQNRTNLLCQSISYIT